MSKKWWLLIILIIIVVGWLIASKYFEGVDPWLGENVGSPIHTGLINTKNSITSTPFWQTWIGPYTYIYTFVGGLFVMFFGYRWATKGQVKLPFQKQSSQIKDYNLQNEPAEPESYPQPKPITQGASSTAESTVTQPTSPTTQEEKVEVEATT